MRKTGFTLAEILISLMILGVIASLTIPSLIQNIHKKDEQVKLKKMTSVINQALATNYALTGKYIEDYPDTDSLLADLKKRISSSTVNNWEITSDGFAYHILTSMQPSDVQQPLGPTNYSLYIYLETSLSELKDKYNYDTFAVDLDVGSSSAHVYGFECMQDRCKLDNHGVAVMNAQDPTKLKWVNGQYVEE